MSFPKEIEINGVKYLWHYATKQQMAGPQDGETWWLVTPPGWAPDTAVWVSDCRPGYYIDTMVRVDLKDRVEQFIRGITQND